jgi:hypothetical protein
MATARHNAHRKDWSHCVALSLTIWAISEQARRRAYVHGVGAAQCIWSAQSAPTLQPSIGSRRPRHLRIRR